MRRHALFAQLLAFLVGILFLVGTATAQPYGGNDPTGNDPSIERLTAILDSLAGGTFSGNPCDLTPEQRKAFDRIAREEFGYEFGWSDLRCDSTGGGDPWMDSCSKRVGELLDSLSGGTFNGDPCALPLEQRIAFDSILQAEYGFSFGWGDIDCDGTGGGDPTKDRIMEIIDSVSGGSFTGNPCDLTMEQRQEIDRRIQEEFGFNLGWSDIDCAGGWDPTKDRIMEIVDSVSGGSFTGNPCDLTMEQRQEIDRRIQEEFGFNLGWASINCDGIGGGDTVIVDDPCGDLTPEQLLAICRILEEVAGANFTGDICDLTLAQRQEIDRRMMEEVGISFGLADFPCDGIISGDPTGGSNSGKAYQTQQAIARMATINRQEKVEGVTLHPNPARTSATVTFTMNRTAQATIAVVNGLGETVMTRPLGTLANGQHTADLDLSSMGAGAYFVKVQLNGRTIQTTPLRVAR
ncbi:MAG: T9SS type A sorting domain-containing protein [Chlorobi bacterium]|nr:T9SS type A sorting domain-containing protein [Chlorobiota bacterium]MBX7217229.1 T9SS type A sorting domain-containing protein [Candidatus Kapabacteria bacterium]